MMSKFSTLFYGKPIVAGGVLYASNVFYEKQGYLNSIPLYDSILMVGSVFLSDVVTTLVADNLELDNEYMKRSIIEGILNAFVYSFAYKFILNSRFQSSARRDSTANYALGFLAVILTDFLENPLLSLMGMKLHM